MRGRRSISLMLLVVPLGAGSFACSRQRPHADEEIGKVAANEKALEESEEDLLARRGALQRERKKLTDERTALAERRKTAPAKERAELDDQEVTLAQRERDVLDQESSLNRKLEELLRQRADMVQRVTAAAGAASGDSTAQLARREQGVALREKDFARREAEIARRESELAIREREQSRRERDGCAQPTIVKTELPRGLKYGRHDVEPVYRKALKLMQDKGILAADLPPSNARLLDDARSAMESGDFTRAKFAADQLYDAVNEIHIDRGFISGKMNRLAATMRGKSLGGDKRKEVDSLFQEATAAYGDGKFPQANGKINRIYGLLK